MNRIRTFFTRFKVLAGVLIVSLILNAVAVSYAIRIFGTETIGEEIGQLIGLSSDSKYQYVSPEFPDIYTRDMLSLSFEKHVGMKEDFGPWKEQVQSRILSESGIEVDAIPANPVIEIEQVNTETLVIRKFEMDAFDGDRIIFYEAMSKDAYANMTDVPDGRQKYPAVLLIPGSGNQGARDNLNLPSNLTDYYYHNAIGIHIANAGYIVYVIENRGWGERAMKVNDGCPYWLEKDREVRCSGVLLELHLQGLGYDLQGLYVKDTLQLLKHMRTLGYVDADNIAVSGLSLGGVIATSVNVADPDIKATVIASGTGSNAKTFSSQAYGNNLKYFDTPDVLATLAPRDIYISFGSREEGMFGYEAGTQYTCNYIKKSYSLFDAEDRVSCITYDGEHGYDVQSVIRFLNATLKN